MNEKGIEPNDDHVFHMQNILTQHLKCLREIQKLSIEIQGMRRWLELIFITIFVCFGIVVIFWRLNNG